ncbi:TIGR01440 family protein [Bacillus sp. FJAT-26390]|uniref:TIGR01440 family protein n=1 Tax=Bacillus sp. FJAT-26390 TaxID=1743142 RepID=UPI000807A5F2|nr:TIGR01440 family protein [Bacillus sp. FJAT-26390]OBZ10015.1 TIGR01440 family protein [Bacillus sp. FJAT-26390]
MSENIQLQPGVIAEQVETIVRELVSAGGIGMSQLLVIGVSTSEVLGHRIGTAGTTETAEQIYAGVEAVRREIGFIPVYQCCEHLNRALVIEQAAAEHYGLDIVGAVPVPKAGGSMAAYAYRQLESPCLVEAVQAHAGVDIGDTFIGMHLKRVAVPVRPTIRRIGEAHVTMAVTRPKLIGGSRAVYELETNITAEQAAGTCD